MKIAMLTSSVLLLVMASCSKNDDGTGSQGPSGAESREAYIDATSKTAWQYFSLTENEIVGSGEESETGNRQWAARTDWDLAVNAYKIRTNSGAATSVSARGGVYTFSAQTAFGSITSLPQGIAFATDRAITQEGMSGTTTTVMSDATVILFKTDENGDKIMPPVYLQAPVYLFRTADGNQYYKVQFTQYQDENKVSGHVKFKFAEIE